MDLLPNSVGGGFWGHGGPGYDAGGGGDRYPWSYYQGVSNAATSCNLCCCSSDTRCPVYLHQVGFALMVVTAPPMVAAEGGDRAYAYDEQTRVQSASFAPLL